MGVLDAMIHTRGGDCAVCARLAERAGDPRPRCRCWKPTASVHEVGCPVYTWAKRREDALIELSIAHLGESEVVA